MAVICNPYKWESFLGTLSYSCLKVQSLINSIKPCYLNNVGLHNLSNFSNNIKFQWANFKHQFLIYPIIILNIWIYDFDLLVTENANPPKPITFIKWVPLKVRPQNGLKLFFFFFQHMPPSIMTQGNTKIHERVINRIRFPKRMRNYKIHRNSSFP